MSQILNPQIIRANPFFLYPPAVGSGNITSFRPSLANNIVFIPFAFPEMIFSFIGIKIGTIFAGGKCAIGIVDPISRRLLIQGDSLDTSVETIVTKAIAPFHLLAGNYFIAFTQNNATSIVHAFTSTSQGQILLSLNDMQISGEIAGGGGSVLPSTLPAGTSLYATSVVPIIVLR